MDNMHNNIIQSFEDIVNDIMEDYNSSKLPKYFKKAKLNNRIEILYSKLNDLTKGHSCIDTSIICDYANILAKSENPFGQYLHCKRAISTDNTAISIFEVNINENDIAMIYINPDNEDGSLCTINYSYISNGRAILSFTENKISILYDSDIYVDGKMSNDISEQGRIIKDYAARCIISDIDSYIKECIIKKGIKI